MSHEKEYDPYEESIGEVPGPTPVEIFGINTQATLPGDLADFLTVEDPEIETHIKNGNSVGAKLGRYKRARLFVATHPHLIKGTAVGLAAGAVATGLIFLNEQKKKE